ncbi:MAG: sugar phosphate isomerase/epimerase [Victivallales bacterium]|nr:sugar phosphate isomerase/epimerase [Victivallales bacterium]
MYRYAISVPDRVADDFAFLDVLSNAKLKRIEFSCSGSTSKEAMTDRIAIMAERQAAGKLEVGSVHIPFGGVWGISAPGEAVRSLAVANARNFIRACAPLNCRNFTLHGSSEPIPTVPSERKKHLMAFRKSIEELLPTAKEFGISLNIEDLPRTCLANTIEEFGEMLDGFPMENIGVCFDVNHLCGCPERVPEALRVFAPRIRALHISDYDGVDETHWYPGLGILDWSAIMDAVRELPNDSVLIFESFGFLSVPQYQNRTIVPEVLLRSFEHCVFELENAAEIKRRINEQNIL